jgi:Ribonuclease-III-like
VNEGLIALQQRLQHVFSNPALLAQALTHRSFSADHNERLEFLGDSVLSLAVSDLKAICRGFGPTSSSRKPCTSCLLIWACPT